MDSLKKKMKNIKIEVPDRYPEIKKQLTFNTHNSYKSKSRLAPFIVVCSCITLFVLTSIIYWQLTIGNGFFQNSIHKNTEFGDNRLGIGAIAVANPIIYYENITRLYYNDQIILNQEENFSKFINNLNLDLVALKSEEKAEDIIKDVLPFTVEINEKFLYQIYFTKNDYVIISHQQVCYIYKLDSAYEHQQQFFQSIDWNK